LRKAESLKDHLAPREALYLDGWAAELESPADALAKWEIVAKLYPDFAPASVNAAIRLLRENRFEEMTAYAKTATAQQYDLRANAFDFLGRGLLGSEHYGAAEAAFKSAVDGGNVESLRSLAATYAAQRDFGKADAILRRAPRAAVDTIVQQAVLALDRGQFSQARDLVLSAVQSADKSRNEWLALQHLTAVTQWLAGNGRAAQREVQVLFANLRAALPNATPPEAQELVGLLLSDALFAQRLGLRPQAMQMLEVAKANPIIRSPELDELAHLVAAQEKLLSGNAAGALADLKPLTTGHELYQARVLLSKAYASANDETGELSQLAWLSNHRGRAYAENEGYHAQQALNVADSNLAAARAAKLRSERTTH
jgi:hypothetical protein